MLWYANAQTINFTTESFRVVTENGLFGICKAQLQLNNVYTKASIHERPGVETGVGGGGGGDG